MTSKFSLEQRLRAVADLLSGKTAKQVADSIGTKPPFIYQWKKVFQSKADGIEEHTNDFDPNEAMTLTMSG